MSDSTLPMTARWEAIHSRPGFAPRFPSEPALRWLHRRFAVAPAHLADVGTGTGRHALVMARAGHIVFASDASAPGIAALTRQAAADGAEMTIAVASADMLPLADASMDGVLSWGVLYYMPWPQLVHAVAEMRRILKPGGRALVLMKSDADSRALTGERIDAHHVRVRLPDPAAPWSAEDGMTLALLGRGAMIHLFESFSECVIDRVTLTRDGERYVDDDWLVELQR